MLRITGLMFNGSILLGMSGAIHLLPLCLHGTDRNIIYVINISNMLRTTLLVFIYPAFSDQVRSNT